MVRTVIAGIEVQSWIIDSGYKINITPVYGGNGFVDINGVEVSDKLGDKVTLNLALEGVPDNAAAQIAEALQSDSIEVEYTTPAPAVSKFKKTAYSAVCSDADPDEQDYESTDGIEWDITIALESVEFITSDGDRL